MLLLVTCCFPLLPILACYVLPACFRLLEVQGALRESLSKSEELCRNLDEVQTQASSEDFAKQSRIDELEKVSWQGGRIRGLVLVRG